MRVRLAASIAVALLLGSCTILLAFGAVESSSREWSSTNKPLASSRVGEAGAGEHDVDPRTNSNPHSPSEQQASGSPGTDAHAIAESVLLAGAPGACLGGPEQGGTHHDRDHAPARYMPAHPSRACPLLLTRPHSPGPQSSCRCRAVCGAGTLSVQTQLPAAA
jgi:hypothetical protein